MRTSLSMIVAATAIACATPPPAHAQNPGQLLQGLLSGNQGQDQAVREAYERGYRQGRDDGARDERARDRRQPPPPPRGQYPDQDPNYARDPYRR